MFSRESGAETELRCRLGCSMSIHDVVREVNTSVHIYSKIIQLWLQKIYNFARLPLWSSRAASHGEP